MMSTSYKLFVLINIVNTYFAQNDDCRVGTYGNNCQWNCPEQCRPLQIFPCNKKTGRCAEGCNNGYYGDKCDKRCSCPSGICYQANGDCYETSATTNRTPQSTTDIVGYTTEKPVHTPVCERGWRTIAIVFIIVLILLLLFGGLMMILYCRFKRRGNCSTDTFCLKASSAADSENVKARREKVGSVEEQLQPLVLSQPIVAEELKNKIRQLTEEKHQAESKCKEMERNLSSLEYQEKENQRIFGLPSNSTNHLMNKNAWLQCPHLIFDKKTVNVKVAQIDDNMVLKNIADTGDPRYNRKRFQKFCGTTCTEPIVKTGFSQYFEAVFEIDLKQPVEEGEVVMQFGFCKEKDRDKTPLIGFKKKCFLVDIANCKLHDKICMVSSYNGKTEHIQELVDNVEGSSLRVMIGIRLDKHMEQIMVYDCLKLSVLHKAGINIGGEIWPMFGVCDKVNAYVTVELKTGRDIEMGKEKKQILQPRHHFE